MVGAAAKWKWISVHEIDWFVRKMDHKIGRRMDCAFDHSYIFRVPLDAGVEMVEWAARIFTWNWMTVSP